MMVISRQAGKEILEKFIYLHNHAWQDDSYGNAPMLNALFVIIEGERQGVIPLDQQ